jgi:hypothetical protein
MTAFNRAICKHSIAAAAQVFCVIFSVWCGCRYAVDRFPDSPHALCCCRSALPAVERAAAPLAEPEGPALTAGTSFRGNQRPGHVSPDGLLMCARMSGGVYHAPSLVHWALAVTGLIHTCGGRPHIGCSGAAAGSGWVLANQCRWVGYQVMYRVEASCCSAAGRDTHVRTCMSGHSMF